MLGKSCIYFFERVAANAQLGVSFCLVVLTFRHECPPYMSLAVGHTLCVIISSYGCVTNHSDQATGCRSRVTTYIRVDKKSEQPTKIKNVSRFQKRGYSTPPPVKLYVFR